MGEEEITLEDIHEDLIRVNESLEDKSLENYVFSAGVFVFAAVQVLEVTRPELVASLDGVLWAVLGFLGLGLIAVYKPLLD
jgi:uncharacterized membrane protein